MLSEQHEGGRVSSSVCKPDLFLLLDPFRKIRAFNLINNPVSTKQAAKKPDSIVPQLWSYSATCRLTIQKEEYKSGAEILTTGILSPKFADEKQTYERARQ